jgi:hypothetical protein
LNRIAEEEDDRNNHKYDITLEFAAEETKRFTRQGEEKLYFGHGGHNPKQ